MGKRAHALPDTLRYLAENLPIWEAAKSDPHTTNLNQINTDIAALVSRIQAGNEGRAGRRPCAGHGTGDRSRVSGDFAGGRSLAALVGDGR